MRDKGRSFKLYTLITMLIVIGALGMLQSCGSLKNLKEMVLENPLNDERISITNTYKGTMQMVLKASIAAGTGMRHSVNALNMVSGANERNPFGRLLRTVLADRADSELANQMEKANSFFEDPALTEAVNGALNKLIDNKLRKLPKAERELGLAYEGFIKAGVYQTYAAKGAFAFAHKVASADHETIAREILRSGITEADLSSLPKNVNKFMTNFGNVYSMAIKFINFGLEVGFISETEIDSIEKEVKAEIGKMLKELREPLKKPPIVSDGNRKMRSSISPILDWFNSLKIDGI